MFSPPFATQKSINPLPRTSLSSIVLLAEKDGPWTPPPRIQHPVSSIAPFRPLHRKTARNPFFPCIRAPRVYLSPRLNAACADVRLRLRKESQRKNLTLNLRCHRNVWSVRQWS